MAESSTYSGASGGGRLFVVATPIGNLADLSPRAREVLAEVSLVLCEDTRHTRKLLSAVGIRATELWRSDAHTEGARLGAILDRLARGEDVALVSDAGTPGISDPGARVVSAALEAGYAVHAVAGPSAVAAALSVAGLPVVPFHFLGFPPRSGLDRWIREASELPGTLVMLESGRRVGRLLAELGRRMPDRQAALCRELTKRFEEVRRAPLIELAELGEVRGEVVLVVGPGEPVGAPPPSGTDLKRAAELLARRWGVSRREAYNRLLALDRARPPKG